MTDVPTRVLRYTGSASACILQVSCTQDRWQGESLVGKKVLEEDDVSHLEPEELKYHRTLARQ